MDTDRLIYRRKPRQPAVRGEVATVKGRFERKGSEGFKGDGRSGRISHEEQCLEGYLRC